MPRIRIEFSKGDQVRFLSHLDLVKTFERAIRRVDLPIAYSEGFNPHPKMNFASALALGVVSDREYLDIELKEEINLDKTAEKFSSALPMGIHINKIAYVADNAPALMGLINRAEYDVFAGLAQPVTSQELENKVKNFLDRSEIVISKWTKKGYRQKDIRPGILSFSALLDKDVQGNVHFKISTVTGNEGNIRPEEVVAAFGELSGLDLNIETPYIRRTCLFSEQKGGLKKDPMDV